MCGLVGIFGDVNTYKSRRFFKQLLWLDTIRGKDSTGIFTVGEDEEVDVIKKALTAQDFLDLGRVDKALGVGNKYRCIVGHNRAATKGAVNHSNAHPFQHGDITLVHNGTLTNEYTLRSYAKHKVDSEMLTDDFNKVGWKETIERVRGAYALIWYDDSTGEINFARNDERPLFLAVLTDCDKNGKPIGKPFLAAASEDWMLEVAASKAGFDFLGEPTKLDLYTKISFELAKLADIKTLKDLWGTGGVTKFDKAVVRPQITSSPTTTRKSTTSKAGDSRKIKADVGFNGSQFVFKPTHSFESEGKFFLLGATRAGTRVKGECTKELSDLVRLNKVETVSARQIGVEMFSFVYGNSGRTVLLDTLGGTFEKKLN